MNNIILNLTEYNNTDDFEYLAKMSNEQKANFIEYFLEFLGAEYKRLIDEPEKSFDLNKHNHKNFCSSLMNDLHRFKTYYQKK